MTENESDLSKRIKELERALKQKELELKDKEKELKHEQAHRRAMEILIELANEHYNIDIRKKLWHQAVKRLHDNQPEISIPDCCSCLGIASKPIIRKKNSYNRNCCVRK